MLASGMHVPMLHREGDAVRVEVSGNSDARPPRCGCEPQTCTCG
jgi:hypothetical protein